MRQGAEDKLARHEGSLCGVRLLPNHGGGFD
jgi:hypothetical protein